LNRFGKIDPDGSRYLLGDHQGILYILFLKQQNKKVHDLKLERVGEVLIFYFLFILSFF